jgi:2-hydroxy-3-keto-5-methylthiopentenyl-1-phosphate phosphatase
VTKWALVSDFDGTACLQDVGDAIVQIFGWPGAWDEVDAAIGRGEINSKEAYEIIYGRMELVAADLLEFVLTHSLDPDFGPAAELFTCRNLPVLIVSDGFDFYIDALLTRHGLSHLSRHSNHLEINDGRVKLDFPYHGHLGCYRCANCKTHHLLKLKEQGYRIVYCGDGHSDRCACQRADLTFAKGYLAGYLEKRRIPFIPFERFADILPHLEDLLTIPGN